MIYNIDFGKRKLQPIDPSDKNDLAIGTMLQVNGYNYSKYVIVQNLGINPRFPSYGARYLTVDLETLNQSQHDAYSLEWLFDNKDDRIQVYITDQILPEDELERIRSRAAVRHKLQQELAALKAENAKLKLEKGKEMAAGQVPPWAKAVIVAVEEIDDCDIMTDYFNTKEGKPIIITFRRIHAAFFLKCGKPPSNPDFHSWRTLPSTGRATNTAKSTAWELATI